MKIPKILIFFLAIALFLSTQDNFSNSKIASASTIQLDANTANSKALSKKPDRLGPDGAAPGSGGRKGNSGGSGGSKTSSSKTLLTPPIHAKTRTHNGKKQVQVTYNYKTEWVNIRNGHLANKKHPVTGIKFDTKGFPKFQSFGSITLPKKYWKSTRATHKKHASLILSKNAASISKFSKNNQKLLKEGKTPIGYT